MPSTLSLAELKHLQLHDFAHPEKETSTQHQEYLRWRSESRPAWADDQVESKLRLIKEHEHFSIGGAFGSGKSTMFAEICAYAMPGTAILLLCLTKVGARMMCQYISFEVGLPTKKAEKKADEKEPPEVVALRISEKSEHIEEGTRIAVMTEGMVFREFLHDPDLSQFGLVLFDDCYEETGLMDVLIGHARQLMRSGNSTRFGLISGPTELTPYHYFLSLPPDAHYVLPSLPFPREVRYASSASAVLDLETWIVDQLTVQLVETTGDVMIFTTGLTRCESIKKRIFSAKLYGRTRRRRSASEADTSGGGITTNVFSNTITPVGFTLVIDTLQRKIKVFDPILDCYQMVTVAASLNEANSTAGRIGRTQSGIALRAATEADFIATTVRSHPPKVTREEYTANLLYKLALEAEDHGREFELPHQPTPALKLRAVTTLKHLGALTPSSGLSSMTITKTGKQMARLSCSPEYARSLVAASDRGCLAEMILLVAANCTSQAIFLADKELAASRIPPRVRKGITAARRRIEMREGDHFVLYNALRLWWQCLGKNDRNEEPANPAAASESKAKKPIKPSTKFATEHGLREEALYEAVDLAKTLRGQAGMKGMLCSGLGKYHISPYINFNREPVQYLDQMRKSLLEGHLHRVAYRVPNSSTKEFHRMIDDRLVRDVHLEGRPGERSILYDSSHSYVLFSSASKSENADTITINNLTYLDREWIEGA
ncbi:uncharacterized protein MKK02DRAFT_40215 [Dioszegia hungarica]|uniref:Helicase-associated domain-containing protein n=1 Tax=Dioszegia hungarica TaxID=4972 RepID=A0AA38LYZ4_9TREE|nr:uncharacterized protein MKK02DRAFT_40215 [Dioszegia hungarica]KAI9639886.1 hypothetical protein MKK02DRAFT_40215 [Dioszegia hungarica]